MWFDTVLGMVGQSASQIWWAWETEDTFRRLNGGDKHAMKKFLEKLTQALMDVVNLLRTKISKHLQKKMNVMLIIDVRLYPSFSLSFSFSINLRSCCSFSFTQPKLSLSLSHIYLH